MKLIIALLFISTNLFAQQTEEKLYPIEVDAEFPGGLDTMMKFIGQNLLYPEAARENNISGQVIASFVIRKDGTMDSIKIVKGIGWGCDEEVIRVLKLMPVWKPATQNGVTVNTRFNIPVNFALADGDKKEKKKKKN